MDGAVVNDPGSETHFGCDPHCSGIEVPEVGEDFSGPKDVPHGEVRAVWYHLKAAGTTRRAMVYTPPGYENGTQRYPMLDPQHVSGEDERARAHQGRANFILDDLLAAEKVRPMIVVMGNGKATKVGEIAKLTDYV